MRSATEPGSAPLWQWGHAGLRPRAGAPAFSLELDLGPVSASLEEVRQELGPSLDDFAPHLSRRDTHLWVSMTITAGDLWLAVLMAMAALTGTGYPPTRVVAEPTQDPVIPCTVTSLLDPR